ncbi:MAG: hypothetical protein E7391_03320 [Ruminococcaceae bacterium]|nr:hypothetical protein [Oscillospiraceae bacterium]
MEGVVKFKDVPKGQKLQYIWDYWRLPAIIIVSLLVLFGWIFSTVFFSQKVDMNILVTCKYSMNEEQIHQIETDFKNSYPKAKDHNYKATYVQNNIEIAEHNPEAYSADITKLIGEISSGDSYVFVLDDDMFEAFKADGLIGTYKEIGIDSDEDIKISLDKVFTNEHFKGKFYLCLRPREVSQLNSEKDVEKYEYAVGFVKFVNSKK